jgi:hypothetical protein
MDDDMLADSAAETLVAVAAVIAALASLVTAIGGYFLAKNVKTSNGLTMAALADRQEGRRIESDVAIHDRTKSETAYVDKLHAQDDADQAKG